MVFTKFTAGTLAKSSEVNGNFNELLKGQCDNALANTTSIDVQGTIDSPFKIVDLFTDSTGDNNTIDTGTTTALYYSTGSYYLSNLILSTIITEPSFETVVTWTYNEVDTNNKLSGAQSSSHATEGTKSYELISAASPANSDYNEITQSVDFTNIDKLEFDYYMTTAYVGANPTFDVYIDAIQVFTTNVATNKNTALTEIIDCASITGTKTLKFRLSQNNGAGSSTIEIYIDNIRTTPNNSFIQSVDTNVGTGFNYAFVRPKLYEAIPTGATITAYVSLDGGSTWSSESNINEIIDLSALTDTGHLVVKMNLNSAGITTAKCLGWSVLLFE